MNDLLGRIRGLAFDLRPAVRVWADAEKLNPQIADQGRGFDPEAVLKATRSSGLIGMQKRSRLVRGHVTVESARGSGNKVNSELPLDNTAGGGTRSLMKLWLPRLS